MKRLLFLSVILLSSALIGCGKTGGASAQSAAAPDPDNTLPGGGPVISTASVTYYAMSMTAAPVNGWITKTYTALGYCAQYLSKTYCWDDGRQTIAAWTYNSSHYGPYYYNYWGLDTHSGGGYQACSGGCLADYMSGPKYVDHSLETALTLTKVNDVLAHGTPTTVTCTVSATELNCGSFVVAL